MIFIQIQLRFSCMWPGVNLKDLGQNHIKMYNLYVYMYRVCLIDWQVAQPMILNCDSFHFLIPLSSIMASCFLPTFEFTGFSNCQDGSKWWSQIQTSKPPWSFGTSQMLHPCFHYVSKTHIKGFATTLITV